MTAIGQQWETLYGMTTAAPPVKSSTSLGLKMLQKRAVSQ